MAAMNITQLQYARHNVSQLMKMQHTMYESYPLYLFDNEEELSNEYYEVEERLQKLLERIHNQLAKKEREFI